MNTFWGMKTEWLPFCGHHKIGLARGVISMHLMKRYRLGGYSFGW